MLHLFILFNLAIAQPLFDLLARSAPFFVAERSQPLDIILLVLLLTILSGLFPSEERLPTVQDYPNNLFTLLGQSYEMRVYESLTRLCPTNICSITEPTPVLADRMMSMLADAGVVYLHIILPPGEPWIGYRQFCQMFLYPLFLQSYKNVPFHPWLRGRIDRIDAEDLNRLMSLRDYLRRGVFAHVYLQAKMQVDYSNTRKDVKTELRNAGFSKQLIESNVRNLSNLVQHLRWRQSRSGWSHYHDENSYAAAERNQKQDFVRRVVRFRRWKLVWDLGSNTGVFSRIASENSELVIAMDADHLAIERLYQALKVEGNTNIHPLVNDIADPSPGVGWRLLERKSLIERGKPDLTLCLALIHHLVIGASIPLKEVIDWLGDLGTDLVIEFVTKEDPMVKKLLLNKVDDYSDYELPKFEHWLSNAFTIERRETLTSNSRILYHASNKSG